MAKEILVNDGGAPARIIPLGLANEAISAGQPVEVMTTGKIRGSTQDFFMSGIALTDAASGALVNVVTGSGVIVRAICDQSASVGDYLNVDTDHLNGIANATSHDDAGSHPVGVCLEDGDGASGNQLLKVLLK